MKFRIDGVDANGKQVRREYEGDTDSQVLALAKQQGLFVSHITPIPDTPPKLEVSPENKATLVCAGVGAVVTLCGFIGAAFSFLSWILVFLGICIFFAAFVRDEHTMNPELICPHCQQKGHAYTDWKTEKRGLSGGKTTAAILTGGLSMLGTGLSREVQIKRAHCDNCGGEWNLAEHGSKLEAFTEKIKDEARNQKQDYPTQE